MAEFIPRPAIFRNARQRVLGELLSLVGERYPPDSAPVNLLAELDDRLGQLEMLIELIHLTLESANKIRMLPRDEEYGFERLFDETRKSAMFVEAFYIFAFRTIDITRYINREIFGIKNIVPEPSGIVLNRNHLIIHPETQKAPVLSISFGVHDGDVFLKGARISYGTPPVKRNDEHRDIGFNKNLTEYQEFIDIWVSEAMRRLA